MNKKAVWLAGGAVLATAMYVFLAVSPATSSGPAGNKIKVVSFKYCLENSKYGKEQQARFEELKKQMETTLQAKEKELKEMAPKLKEDYVDTLTPEAEKELKAKFQKLGNEFSQLQNQYYQVLNQTNQQIIQKFSDYVQKAATQVGKQKGYDLVINEETTSYFSSALDISSEVSVALDDVAKEEQKKEEAMKKEAEKKAAEKKDAELKAAPVGPTGGVEKKADPQGPTGGVEKKADPQGATAAAMGPTGAVAMKNGPQGPTGAADVKADPKGATGTTEKKAGK